ncbi:unnamed protein product [Somion occarium]|uniref:Uncharacterized protein n=1 Tax=Somion occarium TaxID=3059160 RepID=A0ABP1DGC9_9APHY
MSNGQAAVRNAAISSLKFKKLPNKDSQASSYPSTSSSSPSLPTAPPPSFNTPPPQSRDATLSSRYFPAHPGHAGNVLVPSSSPPPADVAYHSHVPTDGSEMLDVIPGLVSDPWGHSSRSQFADLLSTSSGFTDNRDGANASFTRPLQGRSLGTPPAQVQDEHRGEPPRKRINRGENLGSDPLDLFLHPDSPQLQRPGLRRKVNSRVVSSASEDESVSDARSGVAGPSQPHIHRASHSNRPETPASDVSGADNERFTKFKMIHPLHSPAHILAAWKQAGGDESKASALLNNPSWSPPAPKSPTQQRARVAAKTGRVKELDQAREAERNRLKDLGKKSLIHRNRIVEGRPTINTTTPPASRVTIDLTKPSPQTPDSPEIVTKRPKRLKRKIVSSDSEPEFVDSEDEGPSTRQPTNGRSHEMKALDFFNNGTAEALQEVTGCTLEQANKIIELRPFGSIDDLNTRLAQGRKKPGPAGISSRLFEDCTAIFEGYGKVDSILQECEDIGTELRNEIASWTAGSPSAKRSGSNSLRGSPLGSDVMEDGALTLRSQAVLAKKPKYYISTQPSALESGVQLKEYQLLGINWLNLLYQKKLSCILADEMGLGKTVQVISFFAHLRERGPKGPHLIIVPASTLENWLREFQRFASDIHVQAYYESKEKRANLREYLRQNQANQVENGWEVLITTYTIAQGDERDRKFFRSIEWDTCVFDEGHVLKNFQSQRYKALLRFNCRWRLLLTGTPLQNNLQELSLMNFILPEHFEGELESLRAVFKTKGDTKVTLLAQERVSRAKKMLTPFVLRRRKDQVLQDLPKKSERIEWCEMTSLQKSIYNEALRRSRKTVFDEETPNATDSAETSSNGAKKGPKKKTRATARMKDKMYVENSSNVLMDLRKAALHPMLFRRRFTDEVLSSMTKALLKEPDFKKRGALYDLVKEDLSLMTDSELQAFSQTYKSTKKYLQREDCYSQAGKVKVLLKLLKDYQQQGRRILIFSQFTQILDILQRVLDREKMKYLVLTGSTPVDVRQSLVDEFTEDESIPVFLLSTKAGGMGINLTAASVVIMFDQDFNPHNDKQAQDRAYRIGQKRDVEVVKLITKGSIEEDMLQLGMTKLALDEAVAGEEGEERVEQEMKTSLMNVVRRKLEGLKDDGESEEREEGEKQKETGMDIDGDSSLSEVE